jgi:tetratricopeptide (TPR) repeat protein
LPTNTRGDRQSWMLANVKQSLLKIPSMLDGYFQLFSPISTHRKTTTMKRYLTLISTLLLLPVATPAIFASVAQAQFWQWQPGPGYQWQPDICSYSDTECTRDDDGNIIDNRTGDLYDNEGNLIRRARRVNQTDNNNHHETSHLQQGLTYLNQGNNDLALAEFNKVIGLNPQSGLAYTGRGTVYLKMNDRTRSIADLKTAAQLFREQKDPKNYQQVTRLLRLLEE